MIYHPYLKGAVGWLLGLTCLMASSAWAQTPTPLDEIQFSGDIHTVIPGVASSQDEGFYVYDLATGTGGAFIVFGQVDAGGLDAYTFNTPSCSVQAYSLDVTASVLSDGSTQVVRPADVFQTFGPKLLDAQAAGIPDGVNVDAISTDPATCDLIFSIDVIALLGGTVYQPDDLIRWDGSTFSLYRTLNFGVNIDALHILDGGRFLYSIDDDGEVPGLVVQDDDVIESIPGGPGSFQVLVFSPRVLDDSWVPADLDALFAMPGDLAGDFSFTRSSVEHFENAGSLMLTVQRENGSEGSVTVNWTATPGTATLPADYQPPSGSVTFADGQLSGTFPIAINNDKLQEGDEMFTVQISIGSGDGNIVSPSTLTVTIIDDETTIFKDGFED